MDPIAAMLGLGLEDDQKAKLLADQLRGRKQAADFFGVTTVPTIAAGAQAEAKDVMDAANRGGVLVNARKQREATEQLQKARLDEAERVRALNRTLAVQDRDRERRLKLEDEERLRNQRIKEAEDTAYAQDITKDYTTFVNPNDPTDRVTARMQGGEWINESGLPVGLNLKGKLPIEDYARLKDTESNQALAGTTPEYGDDDFTEYTQGKTEAERTRELIDMPKQLLAGIEANATYDPAFEPVVPLTGGVENFIGGTAGLPSSKKMEEQSEWWRKWKYFNELEQRHELFGSALTESEQREWRAATINPNTKPEQIQKFLKKKADLARKMAEFQVASLALKGRSPTDLMAYGGIVDVEDVIRRARSGEYMSDLAERQRRDRADLANRGQDAASVPNMDDLDAEIAKLEAELNQ